MSTPSPDVALAGSSSLASAAGEQTARAGGNAVDAAISAILVSMTTEPSIVSLGAGGFVTVAPPSGPAITFDGYIEMPGRGLPELRRGQGCQRVSLGYGGGVSTVVGPGSVGTPGALAALEAASRQFGRLPWARLFEPALHYAEHGFALPNVSYEYLVHSHELVYGWDPNSHAVLHDGQGRLRGAGEHIRIDGLADTLRELGEGTETLYGGRFGRRIAEAVQRAGGLLTLADLAEYRAIARPTLRAALGPWSFSTNPPPALGGLVLATMLGLMEGHATEGWDAAEVDHLVQVQKAVLSFRAERLSGDRPLEEEVRTLLGISGLDALQRLLGSPSTAQSSAVDSEGTACSISVSSGYGSGMMPPDTGFWLNNCLGEMELNPHGLHADPPGGRLTSNMAPTVGRREDGAVLAIASPGADRITSALLQVIVGLVNTGLSLDEAIRAPRLHLEMGEGEPRVAYEAGVPVDEVELPVRRFDGPHMFFGGVGVAIRSPDGDMTAASDPRRAGGAVVLRHGS